MAAVSCPCDSYINLYQEYLFRSYNTYKDHQLKKMWVAMKIDIERLLKRRPTFEITEVTVKDREKAIAKAESFMFRLPSKLALNGGNITELDVAIGRSLFEFFVRDKAMEYSGTTSMVAINNEVYEDALKGFMSFIESVASHYDLVRTLWMTQAKLYVTHIFSEANKVFEPYIVGELCEKLYLNNKQSKTVIDQLKKEDFLRVIDRQHGQNLLAKLS